MTGEYHLAEFEYPLCGVISMRYFSSSANVSFVSGATKQHQK
jgi:hypothetical protein